ncbi:DUF7682 family zinc-binding protein [Acidithiobacillus thiooxidans]|uniref:DUF7682 family zinc-binding protein n=1 Tax=Acidithiobacillus thiooxidans TaxID=930 RepID=UPI0004E22ECE|nr:hypothetical protein [Acidithiobacillus thiooxidans]
MPTRRKKFDCGHRGLGAYCHRCAQGFTPDRGRLNRRKGKSASAARSGEPLECLGIDLRILPHGSLRKKAQAALLGIVRDGKPYPIFGGKRMLHNRRILSVPLGRNWRLLLEEQEDKRKTVLSILSHESYNRVIAK